MADVTLFFPYDVLPRDNERIGGMVRGKLILSKKYREQKDACSLAARAQYKGPVISGPVTVSGVAVWPDRRKRDLSFFLKGLHDALEGIVYGDDAQITAFHYAVAAPESGRSPGAYLTVSHSPPR